MAEANQDLPRDSSARTGEQDTIEGRVFLVGAGPGDPGLLTLRGHQVLHSCDAVVYDRLAANVLPPDLRADVALHYVGKRADYHPLEQSEINALLIELARQGKAVCRLKGGDPFVFGRGGEEAEALRAEGIPFEIVPGITAGIAAPAYAGIPVTHRGEAVRVTLVTAHEDPTKPNSQVDWRCFGSDANGTVAAYMPVSNLAAIAREMIAGGMDPQTPSAVIERGTLPSQRTVVAPLCQLAEAVAAADIHPPALFVVGRTVALHDRLHWHRERPMHGKRVIVTRPADQASKLVMAIHELGIEPLYCPVIKTLPASESELVPLVKELASYDWVFFTSENGVRYFFAILQKLGLDMRALGRAKLAAVGSGTAARLARYHLQADFVPSVFRGEELLREFTDQVPPDRLRVLRIRGDLGPTTLEDGLSDAGALVDAVVCYHIVRGEVREDILDTIAVDGADAITFTSGSSVEAFQNLILGHGLHERIPAVCIGPVTARAAQKAGWENIVTAPVSTVAGLVECLVQVLSNS